MLLSDVSIRERISEDIVVTPEPVEEQFQPASFDVRLGEQLYHAATDTTSVDGNSHVLEPREAYIGHTMDYVELPLDVAAQLTGRSSIGRQGVIIHKTAGWIDPGFRGEITLELYNFSEDPVVLDVGSRVGQLVFFQLDQESTGYDGQFQDQLGPTAR
jgi:dCTP deaminase